MSSLPEIELSQLPGSSAGEIVDRQEEDGLGSPAAAAAAPLVSAPEIVERQEESPAAAAVPAVSAPDTADRSAPELRQLAGSHTGESELTSEILEADIIFRPVENNLFTRVLVLPNPMAVRYVYAVLFALMTIVDWTVRDIELPRFNNRYGCDGSHDCIAANSVTRVSMGVAIFFLIMFVSSVNTRKRYEFCNFRHSQWWILKASIIFIGYRFATYAPSSLLQFYGTVAHVGAWLFLVIQFFSMASLIMWVNGWCRVESNGHRCILGCYSLDGMHI